MQIRCGYRITYECPRPTPMVLMLSVHPSRMADLAAPAPMVLVPELPACHYRDLYGNVCTRIGAPAGPVTIAGDFIVNDSGLPDAVVPEAEQVPVEALPEDVLGLVRGLSGRARGWPLVHLRCPPQHAEDRPNPDGARARRQRRGALHQLRPDPAGAVPRRDGGSGGLTATPNASLTQCPAGAAHLLAFASRDGSHAAADDPRADPRATSQPVRQ